jgi:hypothetical protein
VPHHRAPQAWAHRPMRPRRQRAVGSARCDPPIVAWMRRALRRECPTAGTVAAPPPCQRALSYRPTLPRSAQPMPATAARRNRAGNKSRRERGMPGRLRARPSPGSRDSTRATAMPKFCQERAKPPNEGSELAAWFCDAAAAATLSLHSKSTQFTYYNLYNYATSARPTASQTSPGSVAAK